MAQLDGNTQLVVTAKAAVVGLGATAAAIVAAFFAVFQLFLGDLQAEVAEIRTAVNAIDRDAAIRLAESERHLRDVLTDVSTGLARTTANLETATRRLDRTGQVIETRLAELETRITGEIRRVEGALGARIDRIAFESGVQSTSTTAVEAARDAARARAARSGTEQDGSEPVVAIPPPRPDLDPF